MNVDIHQEQKILLHHSSISHIAVFAGTTLFLYYNNDLSSIGSYKFLTVLIIVIIGEFFKRQFTSQLDYGCTKIFDLNDSSFKKTFLKVLKNGIKFICAITVLTLLFHIIVVLFGAPLLSNIEDTFLLALTLTSFTFIPAALHLGIDNAIALFKGSKLPISGIFVDAIKLNIKFVISCTWLSAFVLPLDWNRPWQDWPIPCVTGATIGYFISHLATCMKICCFKQEYKTKRV